MRFSLFNGTWELSHKIAIGSTLCSVLLGCSVLVMASSLANKHERIVIMPPVVDQQYQIQWNTANVEYYQSIALVIAGIIGQTTPRNLENTLKTLDIFLSPALQRQMNESLKALSNKLPKDNFSTWFVPFKTSYEAQTGKIFIEGTLNSSLLGSQIQTQQVVYEFILTMAAGKPLITHFNSYDGNTPRTLSVIRTLQQQALEAKASGTPAP